MNPLNNDSSICPSQAALIAEINCLKKEQKKDQVILKELKDTLAVEERVLAAIEHAIESAQFVFLLNREKLKKVEERFKEDNETLYAFQNLNNSFSSPLRANIGSSLELNHQTLSKPTRKRHREDVSNSCDDRQKIARDDKVQAAQIICTMTCNEKRQFEVSTQKSSI